MIFMLKLLFCGDTVPTPDNEALFASSARRFTAMAESIVAAHETFIENYTPELLNDYRK